MQIKEEEEGGHGLLFYVTREFPEHMLSPPESEGSRQETAGHLGRTEEK